MDAPGNPQECFARTPRVGDSRMGEVRMGERDTPLRLSPFRMLRVLDTCRPPGNRIGESYNWLLSWSGYKAVMSSNSNFYDIMHDLSAEFSIFRGNMFSKCHYVFNSMMVKLIYHLDFNIPCYVKICKKPISVFSRFFLLGSQCN